MQTIGLTDFWINRPYCGDTNDFSILSDKWCNLNNCTIGNGKAYYYSGLVNKWQLKCIVIEDTFYFDFSASSISDVIKQQMWILKHTKNIDYKIEFVCLWEMFNLPTIEELNEFAKIKQEVSQPVVQPQAQNTAEDLYNDSLQILVEATGMPESMILPEDNEDLNTYIDSINGLMDEDQDINYEDVTRHATNVYNYHRSNQPESIRFEDLTEEVITEEELYRDALQAITDTSGLETNEFLPLSTSSLNDYLDWIRDITDLPEDGVVGYGTTVYNHHYGT